MTNLLKNIYPPIIAAYMPSFEKDDICKIYFSISKYNSFEDVRKNAQLTLKTQNGNISVLSKKHYPNGIKFFEIQEDSTVAGDAKYFVTLSKSDLEPEEGATEGEFQTDMFYKAQIRFSDSSLEDPVTVDQVSDKTTATEAAWLVENLDYFSEWSTVCLIKAIGTVNMLIGSFKQDGGNYVYGGDLLSVKSTLIFDSQTKNEILSNYLITLKDSSNRIIHQSKKIEYDIYNSNNQIDYSIPVRLTNGSNYSLTISITTNNLFKKDFVYNFVVDKPQLSPAAFTIAATANNKNGSAEITIDGSSTKNTFVVFSRSSSESNFLYWEDINYGYIGSMLDFAKLHDLEELFIDLENSEIYSNSSGLSFLPSENLSDYTWHDFSIKSGVFYKYAIQTIDLTTLARSPLIESKIIFTNFDSMFITTDNQQLKVEYNGAVTSYKRVVSENRVETLGSKYPYIKRAGALNHKEFSISGLISCNTDENTIAKNQEDSLVRMLLDDEYDDLDRDKEIYGYRDIAAMYKEYNAENNVSAYYDYVKEREFREKIVNFLYGNDIKLLRTLTEGNVLVKLTDISLSPQSVLGNLVYNFTATAVEIDEATQENIRKYKIISSPTLDELIQGGKNII